MGDSGGEGEAEGRTVNIRSQVLSREIPGGHREDGKGDTSIRRLTGVQARNVFSIQLDKLCVCGCLLMTADFTCNTSVVSLPHSVVSKLVSYIIVLYIFTHHLSSHTYLSIKIC